MLFTDLVDCFPSSVHAKPRQMIPISIHFAKHFRNNRNNSPSHSFRLGDRRRTMLSFCIGIRFLVQIAILQKENSFYVILFFLSHLLR
jgi:hypothetical protein